MPDRSFTPPGETSSVTATVSAPTDTPDARRYNRIKRWLRIADFVLGLFLLVVLLATGWNGALRDVAYQVAFQRYSLAVFCTFSC